MTQNHPIVVFVLGGPGSGKGTQSEKISEKFGFKHLSAGDLLREERNRKGSEFGELIESYIREGKIVPVEITVNLIKRAMESAGWENGKFLVDGFPRNLDNMTGWRKLLEGKVDERLCLFFDCPEEVMERRLLSRGESSGRSDDNLESIRKRFRTYMTETVPIIESFRAAGKIAQIRADAPVEKVWAEVQEIFNRL
jgi:UMP-CMP kinase